MMQLLETVPMFNCIRCDRYWSLEEFNLHTVESRCLKDNKAENPIVNLKIRAVKQPKVEVKKPEPVQ